MKRCEDCVYFGGQVIFMLQPLSDNFCNHPSSIKHNQVSSKYNKKRQCSFMRDSFQCGEQAMLFKPKETLPPVEVPYKGSWAKFWNILVGR